MILFPAIDLKDGDCVRLRQGVLSEATVFSSNPVAQAEAFESMGFKYLHIVDLNGAFEGEPVNVEAVHRIAAKLSIPVQVGGGIRSMEIIEAWLTEGVSRVILGTAAVRNPDLVREAAEKYPGKVAVGIDARDGRVATEGWAAPTTITALELAKRFEDVGVAAIIHTDIERDGEKTGLNLEATAVLARAVSIPVIASGGLADIEDVRRLLKPEFSCIHGVIAGRALYDGSLDPKEALALLAAAEK
jgi:phosphoribosylformimino-5-aminoimidazole carboxamide ribotide isomerase